MKKVNILISFILLISVLSFSSCLMEYSSFDELSNGSTAAGGQNNYVDSTTSIYIDPGVSSVPATNYMPEATTSSVVTQTTLPAPQNPEATTGSNVVPEVPVTSGAQDYSTFTKAQIIETYEKAVNTTRAYTGSFTATVTESFDAKIKDAHPGGALTELLADNIVKLVGSEGQQTLNFSGSRATNKDGENVPVLLPQRTSFSLPEKGVADASIEKSGDKTHIRIVLVPETVSMGQVPTYNSGAVGYLDTSDMSFSIITISRVDINYTGSVIDAYIRADGYVESVTYTINMSTYAELSGMGITGYGTLEGAQVEKWVINW